MAAIGLTVRSDGTTTGVQNTMQPVKISADTVLNTPLSDSVLDKAIEVGMLDAMHQINKDSRVEAQADLEDSQEQDTFPETREDDSLEKETPKTKKDKRLHDMSLQINELAKERDLFYRKAKELENREKDLQLDRLTQEKDNIDRDIEHLSSVMVSAKQTDDAAAYVQANTMLSDYLLTKRINEDALARAYYDSENAPIESPQETEEDVSRYAALRELSHAREMHSEDYGEWLRENDVYNPFSEEFNPSMARDLFEVKDEFNKYLYANKKQNRIGTSDYYEELDKIIDTVNREKYSAPSFLGFNSNKKSEEETPMRKELGTASLAPVNRSPQKNRQDADRLPPLTQAEKEFAEKCAFYEGAGDRNNKYGRPLQPHEKHAMYQQMKANLSQGRQ
jgi:hypothetical protein